MSGGRNKWRYMLGKGERVIHVHPVHKPQFIDAVVAAILHARKVTKRARHVDSSIERTHQFVVTLRRELRMKSWDRHQIDHLCQVNRWHDAGVPTSYCHKEYHDTLEEAYMKANSKETEAMDSLNVVLEKEVDIVNKMKEVSSEADKLFADIKNLASNM